MFLIKENSNESFWLSSCMHILTHINILDKRHNLKPTQANVKNLTKLKFLKTHTTKEPIQISRLKFIKIEDKKTKII